MNRLAQAYRTIRAQMILNQRHEVLTETRLHDLKLLARTAILYFAGHYLGLVLQGRPDDFPVVLNRILLNK